MPPRPSFVRAYSDTAGTAFTASYRMTYHGTTNLINQKTKYSDLGGLTLVATYTYENLSTNRILTELLAAAVNGEQYFTYIYNDTGITLYKKTAYVSQGGAVKTTYWYTDSSFKTLKAYQPAVPEIGEVLYTV